jgi:hypothetical protein
MLQGCHTGPSLVMSWEGSPAAEQPPMWPPSLPPIGYWPPRPLSGHWPSPPPVDHPGHSYNTSPPPSSHEYWSLPSWAPPAPAGRQAPPCSMAL